MFALNEGYRWRSASFADNLHGVVYLAAFNDAERMRRRPLGEFAWQIFDPQLYLAGLDGDESAKVCARLASHRWFCVDDVPQFDSGESTQTAWQQAVQDHVRNNWTGDPPPDDRINECVRAAIEFQADLRCTHILAPTPLVNEREDEAEAVGNWLDAALQAAESLDFGQPLIATVAVSEAVLNDRSFNAGGFLDTIADQVTSRDGLGGVYIVIAQTQKRHPLSAPENVTRAYAHLTRAFVDAGSDFVFVNFADVFGVACAGLGASGFATGPTQSLRRLCLDALVDDQFGVPFPHLYSHPVIAEFLPEGELARIAERNLLQLVTDRTVHSRDLFEALRQGRDVSQVAAWAESRNNVTAASKHFIARMIREASDYADLSSDERLARSREWLQNAVLNQDALQRRAALDTTPAYAPAQEWQDHLERYG